MKSAILAMMAVLISAPLMSANVWLPLEETPAAAYRDAWNMRAELELDEAPSEAGSLAQAHLDLGDILARAGWPVREGAAGLLPKGFSLDEDSLRLVALQGDDAWEVPALVHLGWLDPNERHGALPGLAFDAALNPRATITWPAVANVKDYVVFFDGDLNGDKPAAQWEGEQAASIERMFWIGPTMTTAGHHEDLGERNGPDVMVIAVEEATVELLTHRGRSTPILDPGVANNPTTLAAGEVALYDLGAATHFVVRSTAPVLALSMTAPAATSSQFIPGIHGSTVDTTFLVPQVARAVRVHVPPGDPATICTSHAGCLAPVPGGGFADLTLDMLAPQTALRFDSDQPVLVQYVPHISHSQQAAAQVPDARGAPTGREFVASTVRFESSLDSGFQIHAFEDASVRMIQGGQLLTTLEVSPEQSTFVDGNQFQRSPNAARDTPPGQDTVPVRLESDARLQVYTGVHSDIGAAFLGAAGGKHGQSFVITGSHTVYALYDATQVSWTHDDATMHRELVAFAPSSQSFAGLDVVHIEANKPILVVPDSGDAPGAKYAHHLSGLPRILEARVVASEYRGYLFELIAPGERDPAFANADADGAVEVPFQVRNLARWDGATLPDDLVFKIRAADPTWGGTATISQWTMTLDDARTRSNAVQLQLPPGATGQSFSFDLSAQSTGNPDLEQSFALIVRQDLIFGVDAWFGDAQSDAGPSRTGLSLSPGESKQIPIVIENTGTGTDQFQLDVATSGAWTASVRDATGAAIDAISLDAGERVPLILRIAAPDDATAAADIVTIDVRSTASTEATRLLAIGSLNLGRGISLAVEPQDAAIQPGSSATYRATVVNIGGDQASILLAATQRLPEGWRMTASPPLSEDPLVLFPGQQQIVDITLAAPGTAQAGDQGFVLLEATVEDAPDARAATAIVGVADTVRMIAASLAAPTTAAPGESLQLVATAQNLGNGRAEVWIVPDGLPPGWEMVLPPSRVLNPGQEAEFPVQITVPATALAGEERLGLRVVSDGDAQSLVANLQVPQIHDLRVGELPATTLRIGDTVSQGIFIRNEGNQVQNVRASTQAPEGWESTLEPAEFDLAPGTSTIVIWTVTANSGSGTERLQARLSSADEDRVAQWPIRVATAELRAGDIQFVRTPNAIGDVGFAVVQIHNDGDVSSLPFDVVLRQGDTQADVVSFQRLGAEGTGVATLQWIASGEPVSVDLIYNDRTSRLADFEPAPAGPNEEAVALPLWILLMGLVCIGRLRR